jgi:hypothetical protein
MLRDEGMFPEERGHGAQSGNDNFADGGAGEKPFAEM